MDSDLSAVRSHPAVIVSVVIAAIALTACALVAIAYLLGWVGVKDVVARGGMAAPGEQVAGTGPGVALLPGETLVDNPESPKAAAPVSPPLPAVASPTPAPPPIRPAPAVRPQPVPPSY